MSVFWIVLVVSLGLVLFLFLLWLYAAKPRAPRPDALAPFLNRDYAHRGLHSADGSIPENSLSAFRRAAESGFGIELDVQLSADGEVFVLHDENLKRMTGRDAPLRDLSRSELKQLRLRGTDEPLPLFSEVLAAVGGRVPFIVEVKPYWHTDELCEKVCALLDAHTGPWCAESFQPRVVRWFKLHRPDVVRGQLMMDFRGEHTLSRPAAFLARNLFTNFLTRPDFIAYRFQDRHILGFRLCKRLFHSLEVSWTLHSEQELEQIRREGGLGIFETLG